MLMAERAAGVISAEPRTKSSSPLPVSINSMRSPLSPRTISTLASPSIDLAESIRALMRSPAPARASFSALCMMSLIWSLLAFIGELPLANGLEPDP